MKIEVTDEMREVLAVYRWAHDLWKKNRISTVPGLAGLESKQRAEIELTRLVADAVERAEQEARRCVEEDCAAPALPGADRCGPHDAEIRTEEERIEADRRAGKPCGACMFVGGVCGACEEHRAKQAQREVGT